MRQWPACSDSWPKECTTISPNGCASAPSIWASRSS
ncbi:Uncharacterised protein [Bordetella pertussis]|nr:Uncharacterised protein [Bordetella pertussis]